MRPALQSASPAKKPAFSPIITLAFWRWRQSRALLLITGLGIICAVMIVCTIAPLTAVSTTAGLRGVLSTPPENAEMTLQVTNAGISARTVSFINQSLAKLFQHNLAPYLEKAAPQFFLALKENKILAPAPPDARDSMVLIASSMRQAAPNLHILSGRLPADAATAPGTVEVAITPYVADSLHLRVGSTLMLGLPYANNLSGVDLNTFKTARLSLQIVGLVSIPSEHSAFWHGYDLEASGNSDTAVQFEALASSAALTNALTASAQQNQLDAIFPRTAPDLTWYYHLDAEHISADQLNDLIARCQALQDDLVSPNVSQISTTGLLFPYVTTLNLYGPPLHLYQAPSILELYRDRLVVVRIPVTILAAQVIALILFFISMMSELLVNRQGDAIAVLRSRGASRRQIFGALATQSLGVGLLALILGPPLALILVYLFTQNIPFLAQQHASNVLTSNLPAMLLSLAPYALGAVLIALVTMLASLHSATSLDVLALRRESARSTHRPLWQRLYLDVVAALVALTAYALSVYISGLGSFLDARSQVLLVIPLSLLTPIFLVIACILLLLRFYPALMRLAARLAASGRSAAPMLALAHMVRNPRQPLRMILLLALAISFAIFTLVFMDSQTQRMHDVAAYQSGADFSGDIPQNVSPLPLRDETAGYRALPGVLAASVGYASHGSSLGSAANAPIELRAVDADTFAQTAFWIEQDTIRQAPSPSLVALMQQLAIRRGSSLAAVPAIVDIATAQRLNLHVGSTFSFKEDAAPGDTTRFLMIAEVPHVPAINDDLAVGNSGGTPPPGALVVDFQSYVAYQQHATGQTVAANHIWLRTVDDPATLTRLRAALQNSDLRLDNVFDRRELDAGMHTDPLYLNLLGILTIGGLTALLLALLGSLLASWLSTRMRQGNFAILRALGTEPGQITRVLSWEQAIIYCAGLLLGALFGGVLATTVVPALVFAGTPISGGTSDASGADFFAIQHIIPAQIAFPPSLGFALASLIAICLVALALMVRTVSQPAISQLLRLNED